MEEEEKHVEKEEEEIVQPKGDPLVWNCHQCTLENPWESKICEICEFPKPQNIPVVEEEE